MNRFNFMGNMDMRKSPKSNSENICEFCQMETITRKHHLTPRSKGGTQTAFCCETCENFIHKTWDHRQLKNTYNSVDIILSDEGFQKFLKWRRKQPAETLFRSNRGKYRDKNKYH
jgi:5-methylcytosine-specific restriction protein A